MDEWFVDIKILEKQEKKSKALLREAIEKKLKGLKNCSVNTEYKLLAYYLLSSVNTWYLQDY